MKMVKIFFVAAMLVAALGTIAVAGGKEDICTQVGTKNDIVTVPPKKDIVYDVKPCNPAFKEVQQSAGKKGI